ncbi:MAG: Ig-like domain-containing protein, partial [Chloroflexota bacterium]
MFGRCTRSISRVLAALLAVLLSSMASNPVGAQPVRSTAVPTEVLGWSPGVSGHLPPGATITLYFNRPMNRSSVERAWSITPSLPGSFAWHGAALMFHPKHALKSGVRYRLSVAPAARAADGISLQGRYAISFSAGDALRVQSYSPYRGTRSVPVNGVIAITFNHPMVTLAGLNAPPRHPAGWRTAVSPHTAGYGSWLGTSTWVFRPSSGLRPATRYTISLAGSARDAWGQSLGHPFTWSFRTVTPEVYSRSPRPGTRFVDPHGRVHITFNQPMDHASVARAFSLQSGGVAIAGGLTWSGLTATFRPLGTLDASSPYVATVGSSARSANGLATLGKAVHWNFRAAPRPKIVSTMPAEGHTTYNFPFPRYGYFPGYQPEPYSVGILFNTPMNQKSLDKHLTIQPAIQRLQTYFSGPNNQGHFTYGIAGDFSQSAQYTITVGPGIRDRFDRPLPGGLTFHFKTSRLAPSVSLYGAGGGFGAISATAGKIVHAPIQFLNVPSVRYTLIRTTLGAISASGCCGGDPAGPVVRRWGVTLADPLDKVQNLSAALKQKDGSPLIPGIYWLRADAPDSIKGLAPGSNPPFATEEVIVTNVNLTLKSAANETLVWANSTVTGNPLAGVRVKLVNYQGNSVASGTTGTSGIHIFKRSSNQGQYSAMVSDRIHFGLAGANWSPNIFFPQPASFTNAYYGGYSGYGCCYYNSGGNYLYTDRPVYRPGQMVHFRGLLWRDTDSVYSLYGAKQAK